ncbi:MAG: DUF4492 domain-containing protein [Tannerella sp.]|jgi:uncharacterized membrane protein|nr:DUF4492 domain-containing protein [Tannerella sp.]
MKRRNIILRIWRFYFEGFRSMTLGKTLWALILIKLFIMFVVLKIFFFPRFLSRYDNEEDKQDHVAKELVDRALTP